MEPIEADIASELTSGIKQFFSKLFNLMDKSLEALEKIGMNVESENYEKDGKRGKQYKITFPKDNKMDDFYILCTYVADEQGNINKDLVHVQCKCGNKKGDLENVKSKEALDEAKKWFKDTFKKPIEDFGGQVEGGSKMRGHIITANFKVTRQGNGEFVTPIPIKCSADPGTALMVVNDILDDKETMSTLEPGDNLFDISINDQDEYELSPCDPDYDYMQELIGDGGTYCTLLVRLARLHDIVSTIRANAKGPKFEDLQRICESAEYDVSYRFRTVQEWCVAACGFCLSLSELLAKNPYEGDRGGYDYETGVPIIQEAYNDLRDAILLCTPNFKPGEQIIMQGWLTELERSIDYTLERPQL